MDEQRKEAKIKKDDFLRKRALEDEKQAKKNRR